MTQPAHKIRFGNLSVTIWRNSSDKGVWYSVKRQGWNLFNLVTI